MSHRKPGRLGFDDDTGGVSAETDDTDDVDPGTSPAPPATRIPEASEELGEDGAQPQSGQPTGSGDPDPQGGFGPGVPAGAYSEAYDLQQRAAGQVYGAVGPEDVSVTYDETD